MHVLDRAVHHIIRKRCFYMWLLCTAITAFMFGCWWGFQGVFFAVVAFIAIAGPVIWVAQRFGVMMAGQDSYDMEV